MKRLIDWWGPVLLTDEERAYIELLIARRIASVADFHADPLDGRKAPEPGERALLGRLEWLFAKGVE